MAYYSKLSRLSKRYKTKRYVKTVVLIVIFICVFLHLCTKINIFADNDASIISSGYRFEDPTRPKYILTWDKYYLITKNGISIFPSLNCAESNCVFTANRDLLNDYTQFDAIIFNDNHLNKKAARPTRRANSQIYIFTTIESSATVPACELHNDDFFNWTFTHRLDSDIVWNYFVVMNVYQDIVAPSKDVKWLKTTNFISPLVRAFFKGRTKIAAWIVSNCEANSLRNVYLTSLQEHLFHYSLQIDVYGRCNDMECDNNDCQEMLLTNYYFYMAFENSFAEDYVTEKVMHGYNNYVVPIVFGAANYSRFLPPDSYINAREYHPYNLADLMVRAVNDPKIYESYFRWTNDYTINSEPTVYHPLCDLCEALNSDKVKYAPAKKQFRIWWNRPHGMKWCLSNEYWKEATRVNLDGRYIYANSLY